VDLADVAFKEEEVFRYLVKAVANLVVLMDQEAVGLF
jgi:hypothetical protein